MSLSQEFIAFAVAQKALRFGAFRTKAGRPSPYFFNAGVFCDGASLDRLAQFYAEAIIGSGIAVDMLFGPAYKGIPLAAATAVALSRQGRNLPYFYNRKETKDHGEGGALIGSEASGRVLIIDDVISAGTSIRESVALIRAAGATPCGVVVALDRMERGSDGKNGGKDGNTLSAVQEVEYTYGIPVIAVATLEDLLSFLARQVEFQEHAAAVAHYRREYGVVQNQI
ncbi:MAG: orotate phosphoribosyltransferase [Betaproteobacteria bacterium]|nr:orotate phosphoribosyltransferase [Betaproteobacteria bacterium]